MEIRNVNANRRLRKFTQFLENTMLMWDKADQKSILTVAKF